MADRKKVGVIGAGSWGTAVANLFADGGQDTTLWGRDREIIESIERNHENKKYLRGLSLSPQLKASTDLVSILESADIVVCSIPTQQIRNVFSPHRKLLAGKVVVNTSKGIEVETHACVSEIFAELSPTSTYVILSGPSFAEEVVRRLPTAVTVASRVPDVASDIQKRISNAYFRAYTSRDVPGVELAGALKNVIAIATGMVNGLKLGYNAQAAIINRGIAEIIRLGKMKKAEPMTFLGLAGMGDLILTCTGPLSRNRRVGVGLGEGKKLEQIQKELGGVAEGVFTAKSAYELSRKFKIEMPITQEVYRILYEGSTPAQALSELMGRDLKDEWEMGRG